MTERLFVYGTLCPGRPNAHLLENIGGSFSKATVRGTLHDQGWGATMGYPAVKLNPEGDIVNGYVFQSDKLQQHWPTLDEFEGEAYKRITTSALLENGETVSAWLYSLNPEIQI